MHAVHCMPTLQLAQQRLLDSCATYCTDHPRSRPRNLLCLSHECTLLCIVILRLLLPGVAQHGEQLPLPQPRIHAGPLLLQRAQRAGAGCAGSGGCSSGSHGCSGGGTRSGSSSCCWQRQRLLVVATAMARVVSAHVAHLLIPAAAVCGACSVVYTCLSVAQHGSQHSV